MLAEKENKEIKKAMNTLDFISADPKERERHNSIIMAEYNRLTSEQNFFEAGKEERRKKQKYRNSKKTIKNRNDNWRNNKGNRPIQIRNWKTKIATKIKEHAKT